MTDIPVLAEQQQLKDFEDFFNSLTDLIAFCEEKSNQPTPGDIEYCRKRIHISVQSLEYIEFHLTENNASSDLLETIRTLLLSFHTISQAWNELEVVHAVPSISATVSSEVLHIGSSSPGRPPFMIDMEKVLYLFSVGFKMTDIARCF